MDYIYYYNSPLGVLQLSSDGEYLTELSFSDKASQMPGYTKQFSVLDKDTFSVLEAPTLSVFKESRKWLDLYFSEKDPGFIPPLNPGGSEFRKAVGEIMLDIPYGKTITYGEIAKMMAKKLGKAKMSAQAVGGAVGRNPIAIIIPCHRVIGAHGNLTGYGGGMDRKLFLLKLEDPDFDKRKYIIPLEKE